MLSSRELGAWQVAKLVGRQLTETTVLAHYYPHQLIGVVEKLTRPHDEVLDGVQATFCQPLLHLSPPSIPRLSCVGAGRWRRSRAGQLLLTWIPPQPREEQGEADAEQQDTTAWVHHELLAAEGSEAACFSAETFEVTVMEYKGQK